MRVALLCAVTSPLQTCALAEAALLLLVNNFWGVWLALKFMQLLRCQISCNLHPEDYMLVHNHLFNNPFNFYFWSKIEEPRCNFLEYNEYFWSPPFKVSLVCIFLFLLRLCVYLFLFCFYFQWFFMLFRIGRTISLVAWAIPKPAGCT